MLKTCNYLSLQRVIEITQITDHRSRITGHWSQITNHRSLITGHWSQVTVTNITIMKGDVLQELLKCNREIQSEQMLLEKQPWDLLKAGLSICARCKPSICSEVSTREVQQSRTQPDKACRQSLPRSGAFTTWGNNSWLLKGKKKKEKSKVW